MSELRASVIRFLGAGAGLYGLYVASVYVLEIWIGLTGELANLLGYVGNMFISYAVSRRFIFRSDNHVGKSFAGYAALAGIGFFTNQLWVWGGITLFDIPAWIPALAFAGVWAPFSFVAQRYVIFNR